MSCLPSLRDSCIKANRCVAFGIRLWSHTEVCSLQTSPSAPCTSSFLQSLDNLARKIVRLLTFATVSLRLLLVLLGFCNYLFFLLGFHASDNRVAILFNFDSFLVSFRLHFSACSLHKIRRADISWILCPLPIKSNIAISWCLAC